MRTVLLKSRPVLRSRDPPSTLFVQYRIGFGTFLVRKISPSKKAASTQTGGAGIGQFLWQQNRGCPLECGAEIYGPPSTDCPLLFPLFLSPHSRGQHLFRSPRFNSDWQNQHKTSSFSHVLRKPPILRYPLLREQTCKRNENTQAGS